jgi:hypothetical protein
VRREVVSCCADGASPVLESEIDLAMRIQDSLALFAKDWLILY